MVAFSDLDTTSAQGREPLALTQTEFPFSLGPNWIDLEKKDMAVSCSPEFATQMIYWSL